MRFGSSWHALCLLLLCAPSPATGSSTVDPCMEALAPTYAAKHADSAKHVECKQLHVRASLLVSSEASVDDLLAYLPDHATHDVNAIVFEYGLSVPLLTVGRMADAFLQARPYWTVYEEEYPWQKTRPGRLVLIHVHRLGKALQHMAKAQNPEDCSKSGLVLRSYHDFDEYGNEHYNIGGDYSRYSADVFVVHIRLFAKFLDDGYCPDQHNKHLCAFLPMTHCPLPVSYLECAAKDSAKENSCVPGGSYDGAHAGGRAVKALKSRDKTPEVHSSPGEMYRSRAVFDFANVDRTKYSMDGAGSLFYTSIFLRRNYDFRSRAAEIVHAFRESTSPRFEPSHSCIGMHIRHHDRVKAGYDMIKYCNEFVRRPDGTCYNRTNNAPIEPDCSNHWDSSYACASAVPFGGITFDAYLKAAELLLDPGQPKVVFIVTDDGEWVEKERQKHLREWAIHVIPAQPNHRSRANINGATLFASVDLLQQCSGLVGHTVSAFTVLLRALMCVRHGPSNNTRFGECPKFYDFRELSGHR